MLAGYAYFIAYRTLLNSLDTYASFKCIKKLGCTDTCRLVTLFSILDGGATIDSGAFTSYLRGASKTTEPAINGESICGVDVQFVFVAVAVVTTSPSTSTTRCAKSRK